MLVNDRKEIRYDGISLQSRLLRMPIKRLGNESVFASLNLSISGREEDGFYNNSEVIDTHNPNIEGSLRLMCLCASVRPASLVYALSQGIN